MANNKVLVQLTSFVADSLRIIVKAKTIVFKFLDNANLKRFASLACVRTSEAVRERGKGGEDNLKE